MTPIFIGVTRLDVVGLGSPTTTLVDEFIGVGEELGESAGVDEYDRFFGVNSATSEFAD